MGVRARNNEVNRFIITTLPAIDEGNAAPAGPLYFTHLVDGDGYETQIILFSRPGQTATGTIQFSVPFGWTPYTSLP